MQHPVQVVYLKFLFLIASAIEHFRDSMGFLPLGLEQIGMDEDDVEYVTTAGAYSVSVLLESETITYISGDDLSRHERAFAGATEGVSK